MTKVSPCHISEGSQKTPGEPSGTPKTQDRTHSRGHRSTLPSAFHLPRASHGGWEEARLVSAARNQGREWLQPAGT